MQALLDRIIIHAPTIALACDTCAELDCLLCFALAARTYNYVRPNMVEDNIIDIKQGRHPLQELVVDLYVPNDISICGGEGLGVVASMVDDEDADEIRPYSVMVLTGANSCGKVMLTLPAGFFLFLLTTQTECLSKTGIWGYCIITNTISTHVMQRQR